ncbi:MAG TPA: aldo/keto reductase [Gemmatimonadetes bacterium]|nr:aldo/keto reductase [Gemmatimonadota bacterium]|tara:strand:- start:2407 stop:3387 length:981 start_codon:yes stop_codon:yes gene_type:complete
MISRRTWLRKTFVAAGALGLRPQIADALIEVGAKPLIKRTIPSTGELLPVIGLGSANTYSATALRESRTEKYDVIRSVLRALTDGGGSVFDTAYSYGASEQVSGQVAAELGISDRIWWATKMNAARVSGGIKDSADLAEARYQIQRSFLRLRIPQIDLFQVHNMGDPLTQIALLRELKQNGYIRYIGITTTFADQYSDLVDVMRSEPIDFIGIDYSVDNRRAEEVIFPMAIERQIGVLVYLPFGRQRMWRRIGNRSLPDWASELDAYTWAQFMLKFAIAHPAVTAVCPGTSNPEHMVDNLGAGRGRIPNPDQIDRMIRLIDSLPMS